MVGTITFNWPELKIEPRIIENCIHRMVNNVDGLPFQQISIPTMVKESCIPLYQTLEPLCVSTHIPSITPQEAHMFLVSMWQHIARYSYYRELAVIVFRAGIPISVIKLIIYKTTNKDDLS